MQLLIQVLARRSREVPDDLGFESRAGCDRQGRRNACELGRVDIGERAWRNWCAASGQLRYEEHSQSLAEIIVREMGKPITEAVGEVSFCKDIYDFCTPTTPSSSWPMSRSSSSAAVDPRVVRRTSLGPLLGIMPWNYPYYQVARFAGPNLVIGNTILLKHAPQCPESAAAIEELFREAGVPEGAYTNIYATNDQIKDVIADPRVRGVSLTGSERAGAAVAEIAGRYLKKVVLELGGSDPFIVLKSDDMDATVEAAVEARLGNTGQVTCNAGKRFIVVDDLYEPFLEKFNAAMTATRSPAIPSSADTVIGPLPLSSASATDRLADQLRHAIEQGAKLVAGGSHDGNFFEPTVITDIPQGADARREEFFGPVAQVYRVASEEEAVQLANDTPYGLGSYVMTTDAEQGQRVADQLDTGMVYINAVGGEGAELPFGGVKRSGFGRELGRFGADEFVNKKLIRTGV